MFHIIDDEPIIRELLEAFVSGAGYDSLSFESGEEYIEFLHSPAFEKPIAVLSDVTMPGINGYELVLKIRKLYPFQKIILITGNADDEHHERAAKQLCYTLDKPYLPEKLISMMNMLSACEKVHKSDDKHEYFKHCEFGIDHDCPFHKLKHLD